MKSTQFRNLRLRVEACRQHTPRAFSRWYVKALPAAKLARKHRALLGEIHLLSSQKATQEAHASASTATDSDRRYLAALSAGLAWRNELLACVEQEELRRGLPSRPPAATPLKVRPRRL